MKTTIHVILCMLVMFFTSVACTEEELIKESSETSSPHSRGENDDNASITNPDLLYNWENVSSIELNSTSGAISTHNVTAPWADGVSTSLSESFCKDVKKEDGWIMLFHTFKDKGKDNKKNYMCLYNLFTGMLKVFYYNEVTPIQSTITYWQLSSSKPLRLLDAPSYFTLPNDFASSNSLLSFTNEVNKNGIKGLTSGWNGFTYQIPSYYKENYDCQITFGASSECVTTYKFSGETTNTITGTITSVTSTDKNVANGTAREGTITRYGKEASNFMNFLKEQSEKSKKEQKGSPLTISKDLVNLLSGITSNQYFKAFQSGLKLLFNRSTVTNYYTTSDVLLKSQGHLLITGTSKMPSVSAASEVAFNLKNLLDGTVKANSGLVLNSEGIGLENLGTWTIKTLPKVYYERVSPIYPTSYTITHYEWDKVEVNGYLIPPPFHYPTPELIINKDLKKYVTYSNISMELVGCVKADNSYYGDSYNDVYKGISTPTIYNDSINHIYSIPTQAFETTIRTPFTSEQINSQVYNMYYDWGTILRGRVIAMVTAEIHYNYNGKTIKTLETRAYPVKYGYTNSFPPEYYHNPPHDFVINYKCPLRQDLELYYHNDPSLIP